jgi:membrane-associated phospholipid phosphatase
MRPLLILITLFIGLAKANSVDMFVKEHVGIDKQDHIMLGMAESMSDYTMYASNAYPYFYILTEEYNKKDKLIAAALVQVTNASFTNLVKMWSKRMRPDNSNDRSFFSGHTSSSFTGAGLVCSQTSGKHCTISLGLAALTGYLRIAANKHWFSDVVVGAGVGYFNGRYFPTIVARF